MLRRVMFFALGLSALLGGSISCCSVIREKKVKRKLAQIENLINIGDDIFEAEKKLKNAGFKIKYGPGFPTASNTYYLMIVDYGIRPDGWQTFKYTVGMEGEDKPISGEIKATPSGEITDIK